MANVLDHGYVAYLMQGGTYMQGRSCGKVNMVRYRVAKILATRTS